MPIYEYQCLSCRNKIEVIQKVSDDKIKTCEKCGGELKRLISKSNFHLKGTGWYVTDYGGKKGGDPSLEKTPPEKPEAKKEEKPGEKKEAPVAEKKSEEKQASPETSPKPSSPTNSASSSKSKAA